MVAATSEEPEYSGAGGAPSTPSSVDFSFTASRVYQKQAVMAKHQTKSNPVVACDGTPIVTADELPHWMKEHTSPYITQDYRLCTTYWSTFVSLFYLHNCWLDTVTALFNIVHASMLYVWLRSSAMELNGEDHFVFGMFYLTCLMHSPPSCLYHLVGCAGKSLWDFLFFQRFDFLFIFVSSIPLSIALCYYPLYNQPALMCVSVFGVIACTGYCLSVIATPFDAARRVKMIAGLVFFYTIPLFYVIITHLWQGHFQSPGLWWAVGALTALTIGAYVYAVKFPECYWPDSFWSSHALMHLMVNAAYFCEFGFLVSAHWWHHAYGTERALDSWFF